MPLPADRAFALFTEGYGLGAAGIHQGVGGPGGWPGILENYAKAAAAA